jgi:hypothetical protein
MFLAVAVAVAFTCHWVIRSFWLATLLSGPLAAGIFQGIVYAELGHLDPFSGVALAITTPVAWVVSLAVGWLIRAARRSRAVAADRVHEVSKAPDAGQR